MENLENRLVTPDRNIVLPQVSRRALLAQAFGGAALAAAAGMGLSAPARAQAPSVNAVLNFALNLEYLEAEFHTLATTGQRIDQQGVGVNGTGTPGNVIVKSNPRVNFTTPAIQQLANEIAFNERSHVQFLRRSLGGAAIARPQIDLLNSFNAAAQAAGIGNSFDPFANEINYLLAAFMFEEVGVTAYKGSAPLLINNDTILDAAAKILAVEAYQSAAIRLRLMKSGGATAQVNAQRISDLRDSADGPEDKDQPLVVGGRFNLVPADANGVAFGRAPEEVLRIAYLKPAGPAAGGGFFPQGVNGSITTVT